MRQFFVLLVLYSLAFASPLDQAYHQAVYLNGSSVISQQLNTTIFINQVPSNGLSKIVETCASGFSVSCVLDPQSKSIILNHTFSSVNDYYTYEVDYGIPYITYTLTINKIPTDKFSSDLSSLFSAAGVPTTMSGAGVVDLAANNSQTVVFTNQLHVNLSYSILMPSQVIAASAGDVSAHFSGTSATFDLTKVLGTGAPMVIKSREVNWAYLCAIMAVLVLATFTLSFYFDQAKRSKGKEIAKKKKPKKE